MNGTGTELQMIDPANNHKKYWRCLVNGNTVITHYGRIGSKGSTTVKHFGDAYEASEYAAKTSSAKRYKGGYETVRWSAPFPVDGRLVEMAQSSTGHTGMGGSDPDATWRVIEAWETWVEYTSGMSIVDVNALLMSDDTPTEVKSLAVHDDRAGLSTLARVAMGGDLPQDVRAVAFMRAQRA